MIVCNFTLNSILYVSHGLCSCTRCQSSCKMFNVDSRGRSHCTLWWDDNVNTLTSTWDLWTLTFTECFMKMKMKLNVQFVILVLILKTFISVVFFTALKQECSLNYRATLPSTAHLFMYYPEEPFNRLLKSIRSRFI